MARLRFATLCMSTSIDFRDQALSIFKILDSITVSGLPSGIQFMEHVSVWDRDKEDEQEVTMRILGYNPSGKHSFVPKESTFTITKSVHRYVLKLNGMALPEPGKYIFRTQIKSESGRWKKVHDIILEVRTV